MACHWSLSKKVVTVSGTSGPCLKSNGYDIYVTIAGNCNGTDPSPAACTNIYCNWQLQLYDANCNTSLANSSACFTGHGYLGCGGSCGDSNICITLRPLLGLLTGNYKFTISFYESSNCLSSAFDSKVQYLHYDHTTNLWTTLLQKPC